MARVYHSGEAVRTGPRCASLGVVPGARSSIDFRKWFDRFQPQTLQIATIFLYLHGAFMLIDIPDGGTLPGYAWDKFSYGPIMMLAFVVAHALGGLLMANDRKLGYRLALVAAFSPFFLSFWIFRGADGVSFLDKLTAGSTLTFIFNVAVVILLLHPTSREHQRVWYK